MAKRPSNPPPDPEDVHREMLEHLEAHPPRKPAPSALPAAPPEKGPVVPPRLMLRQLRLVTALHRLETFVRQERVKGTAEVVVVVGRGLRSANGPVIGPAVQEWCDRHPELVRKWNFAPPEHGGAGALLLALTPAT